MRLCVCVVSVPSGTHYTEHMETRSGCFSNFEEKTRILEINDREKPY